MDSGPRGPSSPRRACMLVAKLRGAAMQRPTRMPSFCDARPSDASPKRGKAAVLERQSAAPAMSSVLLMALDTRAPCLDPNSFWTRSAAANALYANFHGYDFVYAMLPANGTHFGNHPVPRLPVWCRLVVVAAALRAGYEWVAMLDSDVVIHQPYTPLQMLLRFRRLGSKHEALGLAPGRKSLDDPSIAIIAMDNHWWSHGRPCAGNMVFRNVPPVEAFLTAWWRSDAENTYGTTGRWGSDGKREQYALWHLLDRNKSLAAALVTVDAKSLWCVSPTAAYVPDQKATSSRQRPGCGGTLREVGGCAAEFYFCHLPHFPHARQNVRLNGTLNVTLRRFGIHHEAAQLEAAASSLGCPVDGAARCSPTAGFAVVDVLSQDLREAAADLLNGALA